MEKGAGGRALGAGRKPKVTDFVDLKVWRSGREIANGIYDLTSRFPTDEQFGLTSQMKRAAVSISSNIAEGFNRRGSREFQRFASLSLGSCAELRSLLALAADRKFASKAEAEDMVSKIRTEEKMLGALQRSLLTQRPAPSAQRPKGR